MTEIFERTEMGTKPKSIEGISTIKYRQKY